MRKKIVITSVKWFIVVGVIFYLFGFHKLSYHHRQYIDPSFETIAHLDARSGQHWVFSGQWVHGLPLFEPKTVELNQHSIPTVLVLSVFGLGIEYVMNGGP